jgi:hypothetical protein
MVFDTEECTLDVCNVLLLTIDQSNILQQWNKHRFANSHC